MKSFLWMFILFLPFSTLSAQPSEINFLARGLSNMTLELVIKGQNIEKIKNHDHLKIRFPQKGQYELVFVLNEDSVQRLTIEIEGQMNDQYYIMRALDYSFKKVDSLEWKSKENKIDREVVYNYKASEFAPKPESNHSMLYIYPKGIAVNIMEVFLNDQKIGFVSSSEVLACKLYSEGRIKLVYVVGGSRSTEILEVKHGKPLYYVYSTQWGLKKESDSDWEYLINRKEPEQVDYEEDLTNPISEDTKVLREGQGTGFLVHSDGYIVTNYHVVQDASEIKIRGIQNDYNSIFEASVVQVDAYLDLALLKINSSLINFGEPPFKYRASAEVNQTEAVYALGYPIQSIMGDELKVTDGIISSKSGIKGSISNYQFSASVQGGNSGGPLIDQEGNLLGVISSGIRKDLADNANYARKTEFLKLFLNQSGIDFNYKAAADSEKEVSEIVKEYSKYIYIIEVK